MSVPLLAGGLALLTLAFYDLVKTTLGRGGGPLTNRVTALVWRLALAVHQRRQAHGLLDVAGVAGILAVILVWLALVWGGWTLIFASDPGAVVWSESRRPATLAETSRYTGFTMVTLGMGDFEPEDGGWKLATALTAASGFSLITLSLTFLMPLVGAATAKRQLGLYLSTLGRNSQEILRQAWNGESFSAVEPHLQNLSPMIALLAERHLTYPALHYFHAHRNAAVAPSLASLDDALLVLAKGCPAERAPSAALVASARRTISALLSTLDSAFIDAASEPPPPPDLGALRRAGLPVVGDAELAPRFAACEKRRRLLLGFVESDGWTWRDVEAPEDDRPPDERLAPPPAGA